MRLGCSRRRPDRDIPRVRLRGILGSRPSLRSWPAVPCRRRAAAVRAARARAARRRRGARALLRLRHRRHADGYAWAAELDRRLGRSAELRCGRAIRDRGGERDLRAAQTGNSRWCRTEREPSCARDGARRRAVVEHRALGGLESLTPPAGIAARYRGLIAFEQGSLLQVVKTGNGRRRAMRRCAAGEGRGAQPAPSSAPLDVPHGLERLLGKGVGEHPRVPALRRPSTRLDSQPCRVRRMGKASSFAAAIGPAAA
jgi:hypothetical protein